MWIQSYNHAQLNKVTREKIDSAGVAKVSSKIPFFGSRSAPDVPQAYLTQWGPARMSGTHFHANDQFQVVVSGKGSLGRRRLGAYSVHFSRAYTPYGPLRSDAHDDLHYLVMRARFDPGPQRLPAEWPQLKAIPDRKPMQITRHVGFAPLQTAASSPDSLLDAVPEMRSDDGFATRMLSVKPGASAYAPDPSRTGGQYLVIVAGSLLHNEKEYKALALVFVALNESAFHIRAGAQGMQALVLDFPRMLAHSSSST